MERSWKVTLFALLVLLKVVASQSCKSGEAQAFLMGFIGHSGSSAIMSTLMRHSRVKMPWPMEPMHRAKTATDGVLLAKSIFDDSISEGLIPGFKLRPHDVDKGTEEYEKLLADYNIRLIVMKRDNYFKAAIGMYLIRARFDNSPVQGLPENVDRHEHCARNPKSCSFEIDNLRFFAFLMHNFKSSMVKVDKLANSLSWECKLLVTYEDYLYQTGATMSRIYKFLGIDEEANMPRYRKALSDNPCETVANYQEICAELWGCDEFRPYLEDPRNNCFCEDTTRPARENLCNLNLLIAQGPLYCEEKNRFGESRVVACKSH
mmetsp:Transcript_9079/g.27298  ORF Transcript_9079/g.27298 Transcript_9079/m.27298 type:complete len:319 (+) Transcript_9079:192-1148(+)